LPTKVLVIPASYFYSQNKNKNKVACGVASQQLCFYFETKQIRIAIPAFVFILRIKIRIAARGITRDNNPGTRNLFILIYRMP